MKVIFSLISTLLVFLSSTSYALNDVVFQYSLNKSQPSKGKTKKSAESVVLKEGAQVKSAHALNQHQSLSLINIKSK